MKITFSIQRPGDVFYLLNSAKDTKEIFLSSENSMIDTERIDLFENGKCEPQSVNLENLVGNESVVRTINELKEIKGILFPGTLIEDMDGYFHVTMPIIKNGEIIGKRRKIMGIPYVDDWVKLTNRLFGKEKAKEVAKSWPIFFEEPYKTPYDTIKKRSQEEAIASVKSFDFNGDTILPIICNEMPLILDYYKGKPANVILHSCSHFFNSNEKRLEYYGRGLLSFIEKGIVETPFYLAVAEVGNPSHAGLYEVNKKAEIFDYYDKKLLWP